MYQIIFLQQIITSIIITSIIITFKVVVYVYDTLYNIYVVHWFFVFFSGDLFSNLDKHFNNIFIDNGTNHQKNLSI